MYHSMDRHGITRGISNKEGACPEYWARDCGGSDGVLPSGMVIQLQWQQRLTGAMEGI